MAAPVGHLTIKFNSIKFNSLGLLSYETYVAGQEESGCVIWLNCEVNKKEEVSNLLIICVKIIK